MLKSNIYTCERERFIATKANLKLINQIFLCHRVKIIANISTLKLLLQSGI